MFVLVELVVRKCHFDVTACAEARRLAQKGRKVPSGPFSPLGQPAGKHTGATQTATGLPSTAHPATVNVTMYSTPIKPDSNIKFGNIYFPRIHLTPYRYMWWVHLNIGQLRSTLLISVQQFISSHVRGVDPVILVVMWPNTCWTFYAPEIRL